MGENTARSFSRAAKKIEKFHERMVKRSSTSGLGLIGTVPSGLRMIGEEIMFDIKASRPGKGVPVDEGPLRASGRVEGPNNVGEVTLSFGGASAPYALRQHEELSYNHTVGEARYLVRGMERWRPGGSSAMQAMREMTEAAAKAVARSNPRA